MRRVPRVPPWRFGKDRDLQVASTAIETKPFSIPKALQTPNSAFRTPHWMEGYLTLVKAGEHRVGRKSASNGEH
jgi:hypothetical protein